MALFVMLQLLREPRKSGFLLMVLEDLRKCHPNLLQRFRYVVDFPLSSPNSSVYYNSINLLHIDHIITSVTQ